MAVTDFNHNIYFSKLVQNFIPKCKCYLNFISVSITVENLNNFNTLVWENYKCSSIYSLDSYCQLRINSKFKLKITIISKLLK